MNNILVRASSGAVFVLIVIGSLYYSVYSSVICLGAFALLGLIEFYQLFKNSNQISVSTVLGTVVGMIIFIAFSLRLLGEMSWAVTAIISIPVIFISLLSELWRKKENPILNLGVHLFGIVYVIAPFIMMFYIRIYNDYLLIFMFLLIWANDTFAFLTGKMMGKTKLFERISPNKTWEGTIGGIVMTIVIAIVISFLSSKEHGFWIVAALLVSSAAIFGDLLESLFKRSLNIKDSGNIMPGHGGILDRFDAVLFAAPIFLCWWLFYIYFCI